MAFDLACEAEWLGGMEGVVGSQAATTPGVRPDTAISKPGEGPPGTGETYPGSRGSTGQLHPTGQDTDKPRLQGDIVPKTWVFNCTKQFRNMVAVLTHYKHSLQYFH